MHTNSPKLRFPDFSGDWDERKLYEIAAFCDSKRIPLSSTQRRARQGKYPYYGASGVIDYVDSYIFEGEHVLLGEDGANIIDRNSRLAFLVDGKFWVNNHAHVIKAKGSNYFLSEALEKINYEKYNTGTAQPKLNASVCRNIVINVPSIQEQKKISSFLSTVDAWIENLQEQKQELEKYKKGVMQKIFSQEIRFKDDDGKKFPEWRSFQFKDLYSFGPTNSLSRSQLGYKSEGVFNIHYGDIHTEFSSNFYLELENVPTMIDDYSTKKNELVNAGDIIIADASEDYKDIGKTIEILSTDGQNIVAGLHTILGKNKGLFKTLGFMSYLMQSEKQRLKIMKVAQGAKVLGLSKKYLENIEFEMPCDEEQQKIASFLSSIDKLIESKDNQIDEAKQWKKGLLQQMFV